MAGRLKDRLEARFGEERVFIDVDSIGPGVDYHVAISTALKRSAVLVALVGRDWMGALDEANRTRLDDPDDILRWEIEQALDLGTTSSAITIIPAGRDVLSPEQQHTERVMLRLRLPPEPQFGSE